MQETKRNYIALIAVLVLVLAVGAGTVLADAVEPELWVKRLIMTPDSDVYAGIYMNSSGTGDLIRLDRNAVTAFRVDVTGTLTNDGPMLLDGDSDEIQLQVQGHSTQTSDLFVAEQSDGTDKVTINNYGRLDVYGERDAASGYDYFFTVEGEQTGVAGGAKTRAAYIELVRPAGSEAQSGDIEDLGLMVRVDTHAITTTTGAFSRGLDVEAKADNPSGTATGMYGASITAKSDTGAGDVGTMIALQTNVQNNAAVNDYLVSLDARSMRQAATEPTEEYVIHVRQGNTTGTGVDAGIYIESDGSGETDDFNYGVDMSAAEIDNADIRLQNGATIRETTDTVIAFGEFIGFAEGSVETIGAGETIDPVATYHPITSSGNVSTSGDGIAVGTFTGQLLILVNEGSDNITVDGTGGNVECKANVVLDDDDTLTLMWNGADWICLSNYDNS
jgi:hypothetical protein